ncbi:methyltransferase [Nocardioides szechwanensis]|uniref:Methyltransferase domain-containing protein n=1 Tax=Nocardioides szechwanensis TaxID=1005944 RepID=A0A1G9X4A6_9ACTN|nr:methyltransferase domain-containing protein [Nocardioides szechwanensis]GEP32432.1 methyltransferase [Nocardioides szechwanensis]SDM91527.1 Methyltransferase domain-containing protein [Nocardioides szechwanensis]
MTTTFDPSAFKSTTRAQWESAAPAWHEWGPVIEDWLGAATEQMLDDAHLGAGSRVLDVAAGAGGQTLAAARRVGPTGRVLATDISPAILEYAAAEAARAGLANVETVEADGEDLSAVADGSQDSAISRVGLIYFPDQHRALTEICRTLRPGGRLSAVVYSTPDRNGFFAVPVGIIRRVAGLPAPAPGLPGPFSLGAPGVAERAYEAAGLVDVTVTTVPSPIRLPNAAQCVRFERESFGALHQMLSGVTDAERSAAWREIEEALTQFEGADGFVGPCEMLVVSGTRP